MNVYLLDTPRQVRSPIAYTFSLGALTFRYHLPGRPLHAGHVSATSGYANPTLTIVALSLALANYLREIMRQGL
jgi:hypothetical protein